MLPPLTLIPSSRPGQALANIVRSTRWAALTICRLCLDQPSKERASIEGVADQVLAPSADGFVRQDQVIPPLGAAVCHSSQLSRCESRPGALSFAADNDRCLV